MSRAHALIGVVAIAVAAASAACVETRVVHRKGLRTYAPPLTGTVENPPIEQILASRVPEGAELDRATMRYTTPEGEPVLVSLAPRHVILHLHRTLTNEEHELLYRDVIAEHVKSQYRERGEDPRGAIDAVVNARDDVLALLGTMPAGENSPSVRMSSRDGRLRVHSEIARRQGMPLSTLEFIIERGSMRLSAIE